MSLQERLKNALGNRTAGELAQIKQDEKKREQEIFNEIIQRQNVENGKNHNSFNMIPKFYFALPKENEVIKVHSSETF